MGVSADATSILGINTEINNPYQMKPNTQRLSSKFNSLL